MHNNLESITTKFDQFGTNLKSQVDKQISESQSTIKAEINTLKSEFDQKLHEHQLHTETKINTQLNSIRNHNSQYSPDTTYLNYTPTHREGSLKSTFIHNDRILLSTSPARNTRFIPASNTTRYSISH